MNTNPTSVRSVNSDAALPLSVPPELWRGLSESEKGLYSRAQSLFDRFTASAPTSFRKFLLTAGEQVEHVVMAVQLLDQLGLIEVDVSQGEPRISVIAVPEEHVAVRDPDGRTRWVFVARPLEAPVIPPSELN